ncbi:MAG: pilus assembly protein [Lachnospiraceae bacterium]|nr:pilus assembly protein [Lachnospiraceae bacterium]
MKMKASMTVEAALLCPFLCLILCGMITVTLQLYQKVDGYAGNLVNPEREALSSSELIRLEAVTEDLF